MNVKEFEKKIAKIQNDKEKATKKIKLQIEALNTKREELNKVLAAKSKEYDSQILEINKAKNEYIRLIAEAEKKTKQAEALIKGNK